ncbi:hypothetical protein DWX96_09240 [Roseburia sp. AF22-2LB]|nr:hypothetical protein DWY00_08865 [Roseburia sp. AF22-8AC]RGG42443.1 hypothetical protein DWX96_09240 [Roseburia sp. AF22-2LB]
MKSLKLDSFITELNKKQNNKEIKRIKLDSCEGDYSGIAAIGKFIGFFVLLFGVLWLSMVLYRRSF